MTEHRSRFPAGTAMWGRRYAYGAGGVSTRFVQNMHAKPAEIDGEIDAVDRRIEALFAQRADLCKQKAEIGR